MRRPYFYVFLVVIAILAIFSVSCGEEDYQEAIERCETLMVTLCEKSADSCSQSNYDDCATVFRQHMNCGAATDTSKQYDRCITDIQKSSCPSFDALPSSCMDVIILN